MRCEDMLIGLLPALVLSVIVTAPVAALDGVDRRHHQRSQPKADVVPRSWIYQPPRADWKGNRYVSPDGSSWFEAYSTPVAAQPVPEHMDAIYAQRGEQITYTVADATGSPSRVLKATRSSTGRRSSLATEQHGITSPSSIPTHKLEMDAFVNRASRTIDRSEYEGCGGNPDS